MASPHVSHSLLIVTDNFVDCRIHILDIAIHMAITQINVDMFQIDQLFLPVKRGPTSSFGKYKEITTTWELVGVLISPRSCFFLSGLCVKFLVVLPPLEGDLGIPRLTLHDVLCLFQGASTLICLITTTKIGIMNESQYLLISHRTEPLSLLHHPLYRSLSIWLHATKPLLVLEVILVGVPTHHVLASEVLLLVLVLVEASRLLHLGFDIVLLLAMWLESPRLTFHISNSNSHIDGSLMLELPLVNVDNSSILPVSNLRTFLDPELFRAIVS